MKTVINLVLAACAIGLVYICYGSIMGPINFDETKKAREKEIIARLIDIRKAQQEYRTLHQGAYTDNFDSLIDFVKTAKLPFIMKVGTLTDDQLNNGMTEKKAMAIINKAKRTNKWDEVEKEGLQNFRRDTMWVAVMDTIFAKGFNPDSLPYVPYGNGAKFELAIRKDTTKAGAPLNLFQAQVAYDVYLGDLNHQELVNLKDVQTKLGKYCGLRVGDIEQPPSVWE
jgi:GH24 family phage-related lysozyme (muramidase)